MTTSTTVYHLEMLDRQALQAKAAPPGFVVDQLSPPDVEQSRHWYQSVGGSWEWTDRLAWSPEQWQQYVHRPALETWIGRLHGEPAGYFELEKQDDGNVEIAYFGLLPQFFGQGLGGPLLTAAIERAWEMPQTRRLWVHTCTKDHEYALENYRRRGFVVFKTEQE